MTLCIVMQDDAEEATMDCQPAAVAVIDKAQLPELIHEMIDPRPGGADHLGQAVLTDSENYRFCSAFLAEMSQQFMPGRLCCRAPRAPFALVPATRKVSGDRECTGA